MKGARRGLFAATLEPRLRSRRAPPSAAMGMTHMLYRFLKLQRRRLERALGIEPPPPPPKPRVKKERRKRETGRGLFSRFLIAIVYVSAAVILAAHISGRRPLRLLSQLTRRNSTAWGLAGDDGAARDKLPASRRPRGGISGLIGEARLRAIGASSAASAMALGGVTGKVIPRHNLGASDTGANDSFSQDPARNQQDRGNPGSSLPDSNPSKEFANDPHHSAPGASGHLPEPSQLSSGGHGVSKLGAPTTKTDDIDRVGEEDIASGGKEEPQTPSPVSKHERLGGEGAASSHGAPPPISPSHGSSTMGLHDKVRPMADDMFSRRCFISGVTEDSLCVHTPFCVRHSGIVYVAETLKCAPYSNAHGIMGTLSTRRCVETERDMEHRAEIADPEHKSQVWLNALDKDGKLQWFEGETVFLSLGGKARSVAHYSQRIFFLHHILLHPERYGMARVSNVVIAAEAEVARKIKFRKSWHYGLLAAIVHPNKPLFKHSEMRELLSQGPAPPGVIRVFVPTGLENLAKGRQVPCFRRAAIPGAIHSQYLLRQDRYPGVVTHGVGPGRGDDPAVLAAHKRGKFFDGAMLRKQIYASLDRDEPGIRKQVVYLHRAKGRALTVNSRERLERALREVSTELGFAYSMIDLAGKSFNEQVEALSGTAIAVGVHGMQLMSSLFMPADGALIEIFPYKFWHELYSDGCGSGLFYQSLSISKGEDHPDLEKYGGLDACVSSSKECRLWYRSDSRELELAVDDAAEVQRMVREAANVISRSHTAPAT